MRRPRIIALASLLSLATLPAFGEQAGLAEPNWNRAFALYSATSVDTLPAVESLIERSGVASAEDTRAQLQYLLERQDWPVPARELAVFEYLQHLHDMPPFSVDPSVLDYLKNYQVLTLVPHEEGLDAGVPLFNIRAAAHGLSNQWNRAYARQDASRLLSEDPDSIYNRYLTTPNITVRLGIEEAIAEAEPEQLQVLLDRTSQRFRSDPQSANLHAHVSLRLGEVRALADGLSLGNGTDRSEILRQAAVSLPGPDAASLLQYCVHGPQSLAALAIPILAPGAIAEPGTEEMLLATLDDPYLGNSTALALARYGSDAALEQLNQLAGSDTPTGQRVRLVLETMAEERPPATLGGTP